MTAWSPARRWKSAIKCCPSDGQSDHSDGDYSPGNPRFTTDQQRASTATTAPSGAAGLDYLRGQSSFADERGHLRCRRNNHRPKLHWLDVRLPHYRSGACDGRSLRANGDSADGTAKTVSSTTAPAGLTVVTTYNGALTAPANAGSYAVVSSVVDPNYTGSTNGSLTIAQAPATVTVTSAVASYDGTTKPVTVTTAPAGLTVATTYNGVLGIPSGAGSYAVASTVTDPNYFGSGTGSLVISQGAATVTLSGLTQTYDGTAKSVTVNTSPASLTTSVLYNGSPVAPTAAGSYAVTANIVNANYVGSASGTLTIGTASGSITLGGLARAYTEFAAMPVSVTTTPSGLNSSVTYNGSTTIPTLPGTYPLSLRRSPIPMNRGQRLGPW